MRIGYNPFPNKPWFLRVCCTNLLKTLWEKEKLLVRSNFSFSHSVFFLFRKLSAIFIKFEIVVCKLFEFGRVVNLSFEKGLKVALQILGRKFYENTEKSFLNSRSLLILIHKTPVVKSHPTTREIRDLLWPRSTPTGNTVYFYMSSSLIYILEIHKRKFQAWRLMKTLWKIITCL